MPVKWLSSGFPDFGLKHGWASIILLALLSDILLKTNFLWLLNKFHSYGLNSLIYVLSASSRSHEEVMLGAWKSI